MTNHNPSSRGDTKTYLVLVKRTCPECKGVFKDWHGEEAAKHFYQCGAQYIDEEYQRFPKEEA